MSLKAERIAGRVAMFVGVVLAVSAGLLGWGFGALLAMFLLIGGWGLYTAERARPPARGYRTLDDQRAAYERWHGSAGRDPR